MLTRKQIFEGSGSESLFLWGARQTGKSTLLKQLSPDSFNPPASEMSTSYGNELAFQYARSYSDGNYPEGSVLYLVTWKQRARASGVNEATFIR